MTTQAVVGMLLIVLGVVLIVGVGSLYVMARGSARWSQTDGRVVSVSVTESVAGAAVSGGYRVFVEYEYEVDGRVLKGDRIQFGDSLFGWNTRSSRERNRPGFKVDQAVTVYYDPAHPERCTLSRVVPDWWFKQLLAAAVIFVLFGIGVLTGHVGVSG
jgi:hypothetical protein